MFFNAGFYYAQADLYSGYGLQSLTMQTDGKILVADDSFTLDGTHCPLLGRLNLFSDQCGINFAKEFYRVREQP